MANLESLVAQLNEVREQLGQSSGALPPVAVSKRVEALAAQLMAKAKEAMASLEAEAKAMAAELTAKAAALRKAKEPKPPAPEVFPHPWEDHQELDPKQLQHIVESLVQLAKTPSGTRH